MRELIREESAQVLKELINPASIDLSSSLPQISTTKEMASAMRVSDDVLQQMVKDEMMHAHSERGLRFGKQIIIKWIVSGKRFHCKNCNENKLANQRK